VSGLPGVKWMSWTACDSGVNGPWTLGGRRDDLRFISELRFAEYSPR